jgi:predicted phosphodiesterase
VNCTFLAFGDLHHYPGEFLDDKWERWDKIVARSVEENAAFIVGLGDYVHEPEKNRDFAENMLNAPKDLYLALGNHDTEHSSLAYVLSLYKLPHNYYYFDRDGYRFIVLDANYSYIDGEYLHYNPGVARHKPGVIPPDQLAWLVQVIDESDHPCVLLSHHSIERPDGILNRHDLWNVIGQANAKRLHAVMLYINGHHHRDHCTIVNGVCCLDLNSAAYQYISPPFPRYPAEVLALAHGMAYTMNFSEPLSAMITLEGDAKIRIRGLIGEFLFGLTEADVEEMDQGRLSYLRRSVPFIRDYEVDLNAATAVRSRD